MKKESKPVDDSATKDQHTESRSGYPDLLGTSYYAMQGLFEKAQEISMYYGFRPISTPVLESPHTFIAAQHELGEAYEKECLFAKSKSEKYIVRPEQTISTMRAYLEHDMQTLPQPVMLYATGETYTQGTKKEPGTRTYNFSLDSIGSEKSITDALIIRTLVTILEEFGAVDICVQINSIGDRDIRGALAKDITNYYKKHVSHLCKDCQGNHKVSPLTLLTCDQAQCQSYKESAPTYVQHLSPDARAHLKQVAQYLEEMAITYRIDTSLYSTSRYATRTLFTITQPHTDEEGVVTDVLVAEGKRYNCLAKDIGSKKDVPATGCTIYLDNCLLMDTIKDLAPRVIKQPKIYFIQVGFDAKLKSLCVMEILRKARVPVYQSLSKDSLTEQMRIAEKMKIPFCMIFGQKEAMDNTVIIRNMDTHHQDTVKIDALTEYVRGLK